MRATLDINSFPAKHAVWGSVLLRGIGKGCHTMAVSFSGEQGWSGVV